MNYIDFILICLVAVGFLLGYKDGMVRKLIGLAGLFFAIILTYKFSGALGKILEPVFSGELYIAEIVGGFIIFLSTILLVSIIKRIVHPIDKVNKFVNQLLGGISGAIQIIFFASAFILLLNLFSFPSEKDKKNSFMYGFTENLIPSVLNLFLDEGKSFNDLFIDYIESRTPKHVVSDSTDTLAQPDSLGKSDTLKIEDVKLEKDTLIKKSKKKK